MLTKKDLEQIRIIMKEEISSNNDVLRKEFRSNLSDELRKRDIKYFDTFVTKQEVEDIVDEKLYTGLNPLKEQLNVLQDIVVQIKSDLELKFPIINKQVDSNTKRIEILENKVG